MYIFVNGVPDRIDRTYFRSKFGSFFPDLLENTEEMNTFVDGLIDDVYTMFYGVNTLFQCADLQLWYDKARKCYGLLTAWYVTDVYPMYTSGLPTSSSIPIKSKSINGVKIEFGDPIDANNKILDPISFLKNNPFGIKAHSMIKTASRKFAIYVGTSQ